MSKDLCVLASQCVVVVVLGTLVGLGHNSSVTDALIAICGSVAGIGVYDRIKGKNVPPVE